jgi:hypothetical protein
VKARVILLALVSLLGLQLSPCLLAATTIDATNRYAWGANLGWMDWRADNANGAVIGEFVCAGYIYGANVGWLHLGSGSPTNGIQYQNLSGNDYGVNQDGLGNLRGYAYGANIGWVSFENTGAPKIDLSTGKFGGYAYSANCGWISLSNLSAVVQAASLLAGPDTDRNGLPDAWERQNFGHLNVDPNADPDHDGMSNRAEYMAATDPNNGSDCLRITSMTRGDQTPTHTGLQWTSKPNRFYLIELRSALDPAASWFDSGLIPGLGANQAELDLTGSQAFCRIRAVRPLLP